MAHLKTSFLHGEGMQCGMQDLGSGIWDMGRRVQDVGRGTHGSGCGHGGAKAWGTAVPGSGAAGEQRGWAVPARRPTRPHWLLVPKLLT